MAYNIHLAVLMLVACLVIGSGCSLHPIGCYEELNNDKDKGVIFADHAYTPDQCILKCTSAGNKKYIGLHGSQCVCRQERPSFKYQVDPKICNQVCVYNTSLICGGVESTTYYEIADSGTNFVLVHYKGCCTDVRTENDLKDGQKLESDLMTPENCNGYCFRQGYRYSALHNARYCFCSDDKHNSVSEDMCTEKCTGGNFQCGTATTSSFYETTIDDQPEEKMIGCYTDSNNQILNGYIGKLENTNTPRRCSNLCRSLGFKYAGLEKGDECHCGDIPPGTEHIIEKRDCADTCKGSRQKECGGDGRMALYKTPTPPNVSKNLTYVGCYNDYYIDEVLLLKGENKNFRGTLTPDICTNYCKSNGRKEYGYIGLRNAYQCFCSEVRPSFKYFANPSKCNTKCEGDEYLACGGNTITSVYDMEKNRPGNNVEEYYKGCYSDSKDGNKKKAVLDSDYMTAELCVGHCFTNGYRYSAVQNKQCSCDDEIKGEKADDQMCEEECVGNPNQMCGGMGKQSAYYTSISDYPEFFKYLGCFIDSPLRNHTWYTTVLKETNSPRRCMNICKQLGYLYAGYTGGAECSCSNTLAEERKTGTQECKPPLPPGVIIKRKKRLNWRLDVYRTRVEWETSMGSTHFVRSLFPT